MDYKEKYEEAFERAKECYKKSIEQGWTCDKEIYENIFPELRESDDERNQMIKKEVIEMLHYYHSKSPCFIPPQFSLEETLAWLEKQVNIPHFTYDDILALQCAMKVTEKADNELYEQLKSLHDRLHDVYWLEKQGEQKPTQKIKSFEAEHGKYYYCIKDYFCGGKKQASKGDVVQALRGLPIMGLKDASEYFLPVNNIQNHAWSEEDEKKIEMVNNAIDFASNQNLPRRIVNDGDKYMLKDWLKSFKPNNWKPSDEQIKSLRIALQTMPYSKDKENVLVILEELEKL